MKIEEVIELVCVELTLLFIGLRLTGYIDWSWVWCLAPVWVPLLVIGALQYWFVRFSG